MASQITHQKVAGCFAVFYLRSRISCRDGATTNRVSDHSSKYAPGLKQNRIEKAKNNHDMP